MKKKKLLIILLMPFLFAFCFISLNFGLTIKNYTIISSNIKEKTRILVLADLHSQIYGDEQKNLLKKIEEQDPNIILMVGDIAVDHEPILGTEMLLEGIKDMPNTYYVTGNHEFWTNEIEKIRDLFKSYNVVVLSDEYKEININNNYFVIAGIDDPVKTKFEDSNYIQETSMDNSFVELNNKSGYKILLAHRPEKIDLYKEYNFDLIVSGHAHGGQIIIPFFINGLYAPGQGFFPKYAGGLYEHNELIHIVSRGLSFNPLLPRIFNPPEIVVIDLLPEGEKYDEM